METPHYPTSAISERELRSCNTIISINQNAPKLHFERLLGIRQNSMLKLNF